MKVRRLFWGIGGILVFFAFTFLVPAIIALFYDAAAGVPTRALTLPLLGWSYAVPETVLVFLATGTVTATMGLLMQYFGVEEPDLRPREAYAIVGLAWFFIAFFGSLPYLATGALTNPIAAFFESMSGFTTTGATVLTDSLQTYPPSLMMWRALEQWLGGMGIIVLSIALLAGLTHGGQQLMAAETPGLKMERIRPKIAETAKTLWGIYFAFSVVTLVVLTALIHTTGVRLPLREAFFDGLLHTFTSISTGGFSNHDASTAYFDSVWIDLFLIIVMLAAGVNFALHWAAIHHRRPRRFLEDPEWRFYIAVTFGASLFVSAILWRGGVYDIPDSLRYGFLQTVSIVTTTGYTPTAFDDWPDAARLVLLFMFFTGASAGSTSGGLKAVRILVLMKLVVREIRRLLHPRALVPLRLGRTILQDDTIKTVAVFFFTYVSLFIAGTLALAVLGLDMISAISASASAIGNIGPGLGTVFASYAGVETPGLAVLSFLMWAGRLEIFTVLLLFSRATWSRR